MSGGPEAARPRGAAEVVAERDAIQANLLELDDSFVKRMLEGAALTGQTRERWAAAAAALTALWETYLAYTAVIDRIAELQAGQHHRSAKNDQAELSRLLTSGCVQLPDQPAPLARRDVAGTRRPPVTLTTAVAAMRRWFTAVTEVTALVETVWAALGPPLDAATADLAGRRPLVAGLGPELEAEFADAETALAAARAAANADPLANWADGRVDTAEADRVRAQAAALARRITEIDQLRTRAQTRIDALRTASATAVAERQHAIAGWQHAAERVAPLPPPPPLLEPPALASLDALARSGQWARLRAELDRCEAELATAADATGQARQLTMAAVARRAELRGLLGAYKAKAARLGASENDALAARYDHAYELLWTAPCDLTEAESAVADYQQAILATEGQR
jgi:hypothetical protein